jgi:hypothetical protein
MARALSFFIDALALRPMFCAETCNGEERDYRVDR